jgi:rhodanese-related sulfurtransferase
VKRTLAAVALILGGLAAFAGSPYLRPKEIGAVRLAQWIKDRKPGLRIVDVRPKSEFDAFHVPTSVRDVPAEPGSYTETVVITDDASSIPSDAFVLRGGIDAWRKEVLTPKKPTAVTRYFGGVRRGGC